MGSDLLLLRLLSKQRPRLLPPKKRCVAAVKRGAKTMRLATERRPLLWLLLLRWLWSLLTP